MLRVVPVVRGRSVVSAAVRKVIMVRGDEQNPTKAKRELAGKVSSER